MNEGFAWGAFVLDPILAPLVGPVAAAWLAAIVAVLAVLATGIALWRGLRGAWWRGLALLLIALALIVILVLPSVRKTREVAFHED